MQPFSSFQLLNFIVSPPPRFILIGSKAVFCSSTLALWATGLKITFPFFLHSGVNIALHPGQQGSLEVVIRLIMSSQRSLPWCNFKCSNFTCYCWEIKEIITVIFVDWSKLEEAQKKSLCTSLLLPHSSPTSCCSGFCLLHPLDLYLPPYYSP